MSEKLKCCGSYESNLSSNCNEGYETKASYELEDTPASYELSKAPNVQYSFRNFSVSKLNYGYVVNVGCHSFAIEAKENLIKLLTEYISDPNAKEIQWWETKTI